jgi:hypothetical protein
MKQLALNFSVQPSPTSIRDKDLVVRHLEPDSFSTLDILDVPSVATREQAVELCPRFQTEVVLVVVTTAMTVGKQWQRDSTRQNVTDMPQ